MSKFITRVIPITAILILGAFLYFYKISSIPNGTYSDEATIGYNAFSIAQTGKDEYGKSFPIAFRFFGAYTPSLYVYLIAPLVKIFGLSTAILRIPNGILTLLGIILTYFLASKLKIYQYRSTPYLVAMIFSTCPWVIFNARLGYEVTFGYITFLLGVLLTWQGISRQKLSLIGMIVLSLSTYIAHTQRYLVPIFLLTVIICYKKLPSLKQIFILVLTQIPNFYLLTTPSFWVKNTDYTNSGTGNLISDFVSQYLTYLSPNHIFWTSPDINLQHTLPNLALYYPWLIIPFFIGLYFLTTKSNQPSHKFIWILLLTSPIPGAFSGHFISIQRVLPLIIPLTLIIGIGLDFIRQKTKPTIFYLLISISFFVGLLFLWRSYFVFFPIDRANWWSYGYQQVTKYAKHYLHTNLVLDNARNPAAYMSILYHLQYPPQKFQSNFSSDYSSKYYTNPMYQSDYQIANISVRAIDWQKDIYISQILVGDALTISPTQVKEHFLEKAFEIKYPNQKVAFVGYLTHPDQKKKSDQLHRQRQ